MNLTILSHNLFLLNSYALKIYAVEMQIFWTTLEFDFVCQALIPII